MDFLTRFIRTRVPLIREARYFQEKGCRVVLFSHLHDSPF